MNTHTSNHLSPENVFALVVGIEHYQEQTNIDGAVDVACKFADWLTNKGVDSEKITLFLSPSPDKTMELPTYNAIHRFVLSLLDNKHSDDIFYMFWVGHGLTNKENERCLFYQDTSTTTPFLFNLTNFIGAINSTKRAVSVLEHQVYFIDACADFKPKDIRKSLEYANEEQLKNVSDSRWFAIYSSKLGQPAEYDHTFSLELFQLLESYNYLPLPSEMGKIYGRLQQKLKEKNIEIDMGADTLTLDSLPIDPLTDPPTGGTMNPRSKLYIEREADKECWKLLDQGVPLIFIRSPRETGKSSLLQRILYQWQQEVNTKRVFIDLGKIPAKYFNEVKEEENFYIELCESIGEQLNLKSRVDDFWKRKNNLVNFERYLTNYILQEITSPIIIAIDETQRLLKSDHKDDFFGWLKSWQAQQTVNSQISLTIIFSISNEYCLEIEDPKIDFLTFAPIISLTDFTPQQIHQINQQYIKPLPNDIIQTIITLVSGHPALTRLALYKVATGDENINDLLTNATKHEKLFGEHLKPFYSYISQQKSLKAYLTQLCLGEKVETTLPEFLRLEQAGVIRKQGNDVVFRNKLYNDYFSEYLLNK